MKSVCSAFCSTIGFCVMGFSRHNGRIHRLQDNATSVRASEFFTTSVLNSAIIANKTLLGFITWDFLKVSTPLLTRCKIKAYNSLPSTAPNHPFFLTNYHFSLLSNMEGLTESCVNFNWIKAV